MICKSCNKEIVANITEEEFKEHGELCPVCEIKVHMECVSAEPKYNKDNVLTIGEGQVCCYGCACYEGSDSCFFQGKLDSPVKAKCSEYKKIF